MTDRKVNTYPMPAWVETHDTGPVHVTIYEVQEGIALIRRADRKKRQRIPLRYLRDVGVVNADLGRAQY